MSSKVAGTLLMICVVSSVVLAGSYFLPVSLHTTYLRADGRPAGILGQLIPDRDAATAVAYEFPHEAAGVWGPAMYFLPVGLCLLLGLGSPRVRRWTAAISPFLTGFLSTLMIAMVGMADFGINHSRAVGAYVAPAALGTFVLASLLLALALWTGGVGGLERHRILGREDTAGA